MIIAPDSLGDLLQAMADYQTRVGIPTVVRPLSVIRAADPQSNDLPQAIRTYLKRARDAWGTRWAILAGDHDAIPMRFARVTFAVLEDIPTDAYYADLDGSWDGNGNGVYGEVADSLDMSPDLAVGRLSIATRADAQTVVRKTLRYATQPLLPADAKELLMAEVIVPPGWVPGQLVSQDAAWQAESLRLHVPVCKTVDRYYENSGPYPGAIPLDRASALAALNRGYSVVDYMGHGYHSQVSVGTGVLNLADFSALSNGDSLCLFVASNCATAAVDFDCIGERMLRNPGGGCFAYIGPTRNDFPGVAGKMNIRLYDSLYAGAPTTLGEALENVRASLLPAARAEGQERWGYFETVLLGAPTVPIWPCMPETLSVSRPSTVPLDAGSFSVTVLQGGVPAESALVVAWKSPDDYRMVRTDASGAATVPFHPATTGGFSLAVTRAGALPFLDSLTVVAASGAHFSVGVDGIGDGDAGNGDGRADAGETFAITGSLSNTGATGSASSITIQYGAISAGLVVEKGLAVLPPLSSGASTPLPDSLRIRATADPNRGRAEALRICVSDGVRSDTTEIPIQIEAAALLPASCSISDTPFGNGNGTVEPGETVAFTWGIGNGGSGAAVGVAVQLLNPTAGTTLIDTGGPVGDLPAGAVATSPALKVTVGPVVSSRLFDLRLTDSYGHTWSSPADAGRPAAPSGLAVLASGRDWVRLAWTPSPSPGIAGYRISRAPDDGSPVVPASMPVRWSAAFEDEGLAPLTRYRYAVSAVDSAGNDSPLSSELLASTTPPLVTGWPIPLGRSTSSNVVLADLDRDGRPELSVGADYLYVFRSDGSEWRDGDVNPASVGIFNTSLHYMASSPAAADLDFDGVPELIAASWDDSLVAVFGADGSIRPGWPKKGAAPFWSTPAIGDIDGDGGPDIVVGSNTNRLYAWHANGTEVRDGDANPATDGVFFVPVGTVISSPAITDLEHDGRREILFGSSGGRVYALHAAAGAAPFDTAWIFSAAGSFSSSPAVGDIQPGGDLEVAVTSTADSVYVLTSNGARAPGWPRRLPLGTGNGRAPSPVLAPLRQAYSDPSLDVIVAGADGTVAAWDPSGTVLPGWSSVQLGSPTEASPAVADLDGDGSPEVLIGAEDRRLYAFHADGTPVSGFPIETGAEVRSTPAVWDLDGDGSIEIAIAGWDAELHVWRYPGSFTQAGMAWPMWRHDNWRTGVYAFPILTSVLEEPPPPAPSAPPARPELRQNRPNPFNPRTTIRLAVPGPAAEAVTLRVFDVRGRIVATLCAKRLDPGYHDFHWDGRDDRGVPVGSGVYLYRAAIGRTVLTRKMALIQ
ncbi:MAG TPA: C25 family cysteine peptidase [Candidatus Eisenbacteria bacterium]